MEDYKTVLGRMALIPGKMLLTGIGTYLSMLTIH